MSGLADRGIPFKVIYPEGSDANGIKKLALSMGAQDAEEL